MLQELKKISLKKTLPMGLLLLVIGIAMLVKGGPGALLLLGGAKDIDTIPVDQLEGRYVQVEMGVVLDCYAYTEKTGDSRKTQVTSQEYIIPVGEREYMGVEVGAGKIDQADALIDATWEYFSDDSAAFQGETFVVKGTVTPMDSQSLRYYHEVVGYSDMDAETQALMLPLVLKEGQVGNDDLFTVCFFAGVGLLLVGLGLFFPIRALTGGYQKSIKTYCAEKADAQMELERLEVFYETAEPLHGVRMGDDLMMVQDSATTRLLPVSQLVWAYQQTTQHRTNGIPTGKSHSLMLNLDDGKQIAIGMKEAWANELLDAFRQRYPAMVVGYSKELAAMYQKNRAAFCEAARNQAAAPAAKTE